MSMGKLVKKYYHIMQQNYLTFRFLVWLKEKGITRRINYLISHQNDDYLRQHPSDQMLKSRKYFEDNKERVEMVMNLLADDKSRDVWGGVLEYRMNRTPIPDQLYSEHDQYFVKDIIRLQDGEVFVDGGAYTGDTYQQLIDLAKKQNVKIRKCLAFEPDEDNFRIISKFYGRDRRIKLHKKGLFSSNATLFFKSAGASAKVVKSETDAETVEKIKCVNIDGLAGRDKITFIKMDIEGAEWDALHGARETIVKNKPKLTICIYHSDEDRIRLIEYIHEIVPEYKLFVRHHSKSDVETVLYAIAD